MAACGSLLSKTQVWTSNQKCSFRDLLRARCGSTRFLKGSLLQAHHRVHDLVLIPHEVPNLLDDPHDLGSLGLEFAKHRQCSEYLGLMGEVLPTEGRSSGQECFDTLPRNMRLKLLYATSWQKERSCTTLDYNLDPAHGNTGVRPKAWTLGTKNSCLGLENAMSVQVLTCIALLFRYSSPSQQSNCIYFSFQATAARLKVLRTFGSTCSPRFRPALAT